MKVKIVFVVMCLFALSPGFISCKDKEQPLSTPSGISFSQTGTLKLEIAHTFGSVPFAPAPASFVTMALDTIWVEELSYYISNIRLTDINGNTILLKGYFLQNGLPGKAKTITLQNVPAGTYKTITYLIGVDSLANSTVSHTGDLDPGYGMYWPWETGYIFVKLNGLYSAANASFVFDIGGTQNGITVSHDLLPYKIKGTTITSSLKFDLEKVFNAPNVYDLKVDPTSIHSTNDPAIRKLSSNIQHAFSVTSVH